MFKKNQGINPLTGLNLLQRTHAQRARAAGTGEYQSPYGAKPSATPFRGQPYARDYLGRNPLTGLNLLQPHTRVGEAIGSPSRVAIPLRG